MENFTLSYASENLGELIISHKSREKDYDIMAVCDKNKKELLALHIKFGILPANILKLIFDSIDALDYAG